MYLNFRTLLVTHSNSADVVVSVGWWLIWRVPWCFFRSFVARQFKMNFLPECIEPLVFRLKRSHCARGNRDESHTSFLNAELTHQACRSIFDLILIFNRKRKHFESFCSFFILAIGHWRYLVRKITAKSRRCINPSHISSIVQNKGKLKLRLQVWLA